MGYEKTKGFDVDKFVSQQSDVDFDPNNSVNFFDGISFTYGRFYEDRYKRRERRKKLAEHTRKDPSFRSYD